MRRKVLSVFMAFSLFLSLSSVSLAKGPQFGFGPKGDANKVQEKRLEMKGEDMIRERSKEKDMLRDRLKERKMEHAPSLDLPNP